MIPSELGYIFVFDGRKRFAVQTNLSFRRLIKRSHDIQKRSLARSAFSHNRDILALLHRKIYAGKRLHLIAAKAGAVYLLKIFHFQNSHILCPPSFDLQSV